MMQKMQNMMGGGAMPGGFPPGALPPGFPR
jgi:hypothetical protein